MRAEPAQLDRRRHGHQRLVGTDVRGRLLSPDVLLSCTQSRDVGPSPLDVDRLADQATWEPAHLRVGDGEEPQVGPTEAERGPERLPLPHHHVGAVAARRLEHRGHHGIRCDDHDSTGLVAATTHLGQILELTEPRGVTDDDRPWCIAGIDRVETRATIDEWELDDVVPCASGEGTNHLSPGRVHAGREPDGLSTRRGDRQVDRFDHRGRTVIERRIGDRETREPGDHRLELEDRLEHPLRDLRLIGGVGGDELAASSKRPDHWRNLVVVGPHPCETHHPRSSGAVGGRHRADLCRDVGLGKAVRERELSVELERLWDRIEELVD